MIGMSLEQIWDADVDTFRYLCYLILNQKPILIAGELFHVHITRTIDYSRTRFSESRAQPLQKHYNRISKEGASSISLAFARYAHSVELLEMRTHRVQLTVGDEMSLLEANYECLYYDLSVDLGLNGCQFVRLEFVPLESSPLLINKAKLEVLFRAARSGDIHMLEQTLAVLGPEIDMQVELNGENLIVAIYNAVPEKNPPFFAQQNYNACISTIFERGFDCNKPLKCDSKCTTTDLVACWKALNGPCYDISFNPSFFGFHLLPRKDNKIAVYDLVDQFNSNCELHHADVDNAHAINIAY